MGRKLTFAIAVALFCIQQGNAEEEGGTKVTTSGFVYYQIGQIERSFDKGSSYGAWDKAWEQHCNFRLTVDAVVQKHLRIIAGVEMGWFTMVNGRGASGVFQKDIAFKEGQGIYTFGEDPANPNPILQVALGYFPFKYNPQATNMGEYLFSYRTGAYPPYIINDFDNCKARLLGLRISSTLSDTQLGSLRQYLLLTSEMTMAPYGDYSLSYLVGVKYQKLLDIGGGICFNRLLSADPKLTDSMGGIVYDNQFNPVFVNGDTLDTLRYTLRAIKLMARITFDPKQLLPPLPFFGTEDGKIYCETAVLGLKNYGSMYYDKVSKRTPLMVGFNIPVCNVLDFLSLEYERFSYPMMNDIANANSPLPTGGIDDVSKYNMNHWSLFAQKTVVKGFTIKGLIGKDHYRTVDAGGNPYKVEPLRKNGDWHYNLRFMYSF